MKWFSMTAVYYWKSSPPKQRRYERRVTLCSAKNAKKAEAKLLKEAKSYTKALDGVVFLDAYFSGKLGDPPGKTPVEIDYELTLAVDPKSGKALKPKQFLCEHWAYDRVKNCEDFGFKHAWYNKDDVNSGCHNCRIIRKGQLWKNT